MNREMLTLALSRARRPAFRDLISVLIGRYDGYDALTRRHGEMSQAFRADREGVPVERLREQIAREVAKHALRPDEVERFRQQREDQVRGATTDERLFRLVFLDAAYERHTQQRWLDWKKLPPELRPLRQAEVSHLDEDRWILTRLAEANGWAVPESLWDKRDRLRRSAR